MLLIDMPSGLLADRWSRKGVLILASFALAGAAFVGGVSNDIGLYLLCAILWGVFYACYAGMYESIVYDTLAEEKQSPALYRKIYGRIQIADSAGLVLGGLVSAFVATQLGLRETYFLSIPFALLAVTSLLLFREPQLHKHRRQLLGTQVRETFRVVTRRGYALPVVISLVIKTTILFMMFEFAQLWLIALNAPTGFFGFAGALLYAAIGFGGWFAQHLHVASRKIGMVVLASLMSLVGLLFTHSIVLVALLQFVVIGTLVALSIALTNILHDLLSSNIRASAVSATSTFGRALILPLALAFGYVSEQNSVFSATYILVGLCVFMGLFVYKSVNRHASTM
jgi:MFS family permease